MVVRRGTLTSWVVVFAFATIFPALARAEDPVVDSVAVSTEDGDATVSVGLDAQVRFEVIDRSGDEVLSRFRLRRFRPILKFEGFRQFEVKVVPEFAGDPELKDGVVRWIPNDWFKLEAGQFAPPFNWERDGSSDYHQFLERSVANNEFQIADGRDIGVQFDFEWDQLLDVEAGLFNGAGSNTAATPGKGHVAAWRVAFAPFGFYHEVEVLPKVMDRPVLMLGMGGFAAIDNAWRDWARPGTSTNSDADDPTSADVWSITGDAHIWAWRMNLHATVFHRKVRPCCAENSGPAYTGAGFTGQAGFLLIPERLMLAYRHSRSAVDSTRSPDTLEHAVSVQAFHVGNESKFTLEVGSIERDLPGEADESFARLQYQLLL